MELNTLIARITTLQHELAGHMPLKGDAQEKLDKKFRLEFNYNSNHIEGNTLTYGETELYLIFDKTTGNHDGREYEEMRASDAALKMIQEYAAEKERPLTEAFIKSLNELILVRPYWVDAITPSGQPTRRQIIPGGYKKQPNSVRLQNGEMFHYTSPEETPIQMGELVEWYRAEIEKNELHPVALAALLHYRFVRIHPFDDGNGRISRLLMNYVLYANDLPPVVVKSADKKNYLFALNQADAGDINAFVEYIARQLVWSLELSIKAAKGERIEEQDDLEKEISIWKKEVQSKHPEDSLRKSERILAQAYSNEISPLLECIIEKVASFNDLFRSTIFKSSVNGKNPMVNDKKGKEYIDAFFTKKRSSVVRVPIKDIESINFLVLLKDFKKLVAPLHVEIHIGILFSPYDYTIQFSTPNDKFVKAINYSDGLSREECWSLAMQVQKRVFEYLKSKTDAS